MHRASLKRMLKRLPLAGCLIQAKRRLEWPRRFMPIGVSSFMSACNDLVGNRVVSLPLADEEGAWYTKRPLLWAHAGGAWQIKFANTKEAIEYSIKVGFNVIELDVAVTSDGMVVLSHDFRPNNERYFDGVPIANQFLQTPVCGSYTPLSISDLWEKYGCWDGFFALDQTKTSSRPHFDMIAYLKRNAPASFLKKVIYLACSFEDLKELQSDNPFAAIHFCLFSCPPLSLVNALIRVFAATNVHSVSFCDTDITEGVAKVVDAFSKANIHVSIVGVDTIERYRTWLSIGTKCINTNYLTPLDIVRSIETYGPTN